MFSLLKSQISLLHFHQNHFALVLSLNRVCVCVCVDSKLGAAEVWTSRQALQDLYQKMLVTDLEYALDKKVEQDL